MNTAEHYANIAEHYDPSFLGADHARWERDHIISHLRLQQTDRVLDLGAGTGAFASQLYQKAGLSNPVIAIEPSQPMLDQAKTVPGLIPYCTDALSFVINTDIRYDKVLMKGMIHHVPKKNLPVLYRAIYHQLLLGGIALTMTRPHVVPYPFFEAAHKVWSDHQPPFNEFGEEMERAGFLVSCHAYDYPVAIEKMQWFSFIRNRYWSTFSYFSNEEIEEGIQEIETQYPEEDVLSFTDTILLLEAVKQ